MFAFPYIFVDSNGSYEYKDGSLYSLPAELKDEFRITKYLGLNGVGFHRSEYGYYALLSEDKRGNTYILPGLYLTDQPAPLKKIKGYNALFSMAQVRSYMERHLDWELGISAKSELELTALVHDLRHLSGSIYHSAVEAERALSSKDHRKTREGIKTVIASQTMLKIRIDYLDYANSVDRFEDTETIPVYSRVDKVIRCFRASARYRGIVIKLSGTSYRLASGPNILDIVPYTLIENSIKYSPASGLVTVAISDGSQDTTVAVTSLGPIINIGEEDAIFRRGYRGKNAAQVLSTGTGLGLAVAKNVVDQFGGIISVVQDIQPHLINGIEYRSTTFSFSLPTSGEHGGRKKQKMDIQLGKKARLDRSLKKLREKFTVK